MRTATRVAAIMILAASAAPASASAQFFVESPSLRAPKEVSFEGGLGRAFTSAGTSDTYGYPMFRAGLGTRVEVRAILPSFQRNAEGTQSGLTDGSLGVKAGLGERAGVKFAVASVTSLPTGESSFRQSAVSNNTFATAGGTLLGLSWALRGGVRVAHTKSYYVDAGTGHTLGRGVTANFDVLKPLGAGSTISLIPSVALDVSPTLILAAWSGVETGPTRTPFVGIGFFRILAH